MQQTLPAPDREFFAPLHGLRGVAVLYVVVSHLGNASLFLLPISHDAVGKVGVWIFFVLSAFLLTTHLLSEFEATSSKAFSLLTYIIHRIFRIYPLYILVLIGHMILGDISAMEFLKHLLLIQGMGELWAIPVEFQYYFIIPIIAIVSLYLPYKHINLILMVAMMITLFYGIMFPVSVFSNELNSIPKLTPFLLGSMLALLIYGKVSPKRKVNRRGFALLIGLACLTVLLVTTILYRCLSKDCLSNSFAPWLSIAISISVMGLIYSVLRPNAIGTLLEVVPLVFLGEISFSVYLLRMFVIRFVAQKNYGLPAVAEAWLTLGLCVLCASVSYWAIERPGIRAGKFLSRKITNNWIPAAGRSTASSDNI